MWWSTMNIRLLSSTSCSGTPSRNGFNISSVTPSLKNTPITFQHAVFPRAGGNRTGVLNSCNFIVFGCFLVNALNQASLVAHYNKRAGTCLGFVCTTRCTSDSCWRPAGSRKTSRYSIAWRPETGERNQSKAILLKCV